MQTWVVLSDLQIPFQDKRAVALALRFVDLVAPDGVILNGDIADCYSISDYSKDPLTEASLVRERTEVRGVLEQLAQVPAKVFIGGNHEDRLRRLLWKHAPGLGVMPELGFDQLFGLADYGFKWLPYGDYYLLGKLLVTHGTIVRKHSGWTAAAHFDKYGESVLVGHTHRMGAYYKTRLNKTYVAYENGCLCRLDPEYAVAPDWQQGFSVVHVDERTGFFSVQQVPILRQRRGLIAFYGREAVYG